MLLMIGSLHLVLQMTVDVTELTANKILEYFCKIMHCFPSSGNNIRLMQWS